MTRYYTDIREISKLSDRIIGIDYSRSNVGLAISDHNIEYAMPLKVLNVKNYNKCLDVISNVLKDYKINFCVVGMPWRENGLVNFQMKIIRKFIKDILKKNINLELFVQDESLSTVDANAIAYNLNIHGEPNDHFAASVILTRFIEKYRMHYDIN